MRFSSYWDVHAISSGILSLKSFLFPPLISHSSPPPPLPLCGIQTKPSLLMCALFAFLHKSSLPCPLYFLHLLHPLLLPTLSPTPKGFYRFNLKSFAFMFPISSPRTSASFYHRPIVYLSLSFSPETLLAGYFSLS